MTRIELEKSPPVFAEETELTDCLRCFIALPAFDCFKVMDRHFVLMQSRSADAIAAAVRGNPALSVKIQFK